MTPKVRSVPARARMTPVAPSVAKNVDELLADLRGKPPRITGPRYDTIAISIILPIFTLIVRPPTHSQFPHTTMAGKPPPTPPPSSIKFTKMGVLFTRPRKIQPGQGI